MPRLKMQIKADKETRRRWNHELYIVNQKLREYRLCLQVGYGDCSKEPKFICYVTDSEYKRAVPVVAGFNPVHAVDMIRFVNDNNPTWGSILRLHKQPWMLEQLEYCLGDAMDTIKRINIDLENYRKTNEQGR